MGAWGRGRCLRPSREDASRRPMGCPRWEPVSVGERSRHRPRRAPAQRRLSDSSWPTRWASGWALLRRCLPSRDLWRGVPANREQDGQSTPDWVVTPTLDTGYGVPPMNGKTTNGARSSCTASNVPSLVRHRGRSGSAVMTGPSTTRSRQPFDHHRCRWRPVGSAYHPGAGMRSR